jgi:hypothetical protein
LEVEANEFVKERYKVMSYPLIAWFEKDNFEIRAIYKGNRTFNDMKKWMDDFMSEETVSKSLDEDKIDTEMVVVKNDVNSDNDVEHIKDEIEKLKKGFYEIEVSLMDMRKNSEFKMPTNFTIFSFLGGVLVLVAFGVTVKKILGRKLKEIDVHDKV